MAERKKKSKSRKTASKAVKKTKTKAKKSMKQASKTRTTKAKKTKAKASTTAKTAKKGKSKKSVKKTTKSKNQTSSNLPARTNFKKMGLVEYKKVANPIVRRHAKKKWWPVKVNEHHYDLVLRMAKDRNLHPQKLLEKVKESEHPADVFIKREKGKK